METTEDRLSDFTQDRRVLVLSAMALFIGAASAIVAVVLLWLIAAITNLAYFDEFSSTLQSLAHHRLGYWVVVVPIIGGFHLENNILFPKAIALEQQVLTV